MSLYTKIVNSLDTENPGFSGRKISTAVALLTAVFIACFKLPPNDRIYAIYAFLIFAAVGLSLVTIPDLIKVLNAKNGTIIETTKVETQTTTTP